MNDRIESNAYSSSFHSIERTRIFSVLSMLVLNTLVLLSGVLIHTNIYHSFIVFLLGIFISLYQKFIQDELCLIHEARFRVLMETKSGSKSLYENEWTQLSEEGKENSPVYSIQIETYVPYVFVFFHVITLVVNAFGDYLI